MKKKKKKFYVSRKNYMLLILPFVYTPSITLKFSLREFQSRPKRQIKCPITVRIVGSRLSSHSILINRDILPKAPHQNHSAACQP